MITLTLSAKYTFSNAIISIFSLPSRSTRKVFAQTFMGHYIGELLRLILQSPGLSKCLPFTITIHNYFFFFSQIKFLLFTSGLETTTNIYNQFIQYVGVQSSCQCSKEMIIKDDPLSKCNISVPRLVSHQTPFSFFFFIF